jgi:hypothetical protein
MVAEGNRFKNSFQHEHAGLSMFRIMLARFFKPFFRCRYARRCLYYKPENFTCNHPTAENGYCGMFRELSENRQTLSQKA